MERFIEVSSAPRASAKGCEEEVEDATLDRSATASSFPVVENFDEEPYSSGYESSIDNEKSNDHGGQDDWETDPLPTCPVCLDPFDSEPAVFEDKRQSTLPALSRKCSHKVCCSCLASMQAAEAEGSKKLRKYFTCPICKAKSAFNAVDMQVDVFACQCISRIKGLRTLNGETEERVDSKSNAGHMIFGTQLDRSHCDERANYASNPDVMTGPSASKSAADRISELESQRTILTKAKGEAESNLKRSCSARRAILKKLFKEEIENGKLSKRLAKSENSLRLSVSYAKEVSCSIVALRKELREARKSTKECGAKERRIMMQKIKELSEAVAKGQKRKREAIEKERRIMKDAIAKERKSLDGIMRDLNWIKNDFQNNGASQALSYSSFTSYLPAPVWPGHDCMPCPMSGTHRPPQGDPNWPIYKHNSITKHGNEKKAGEVLI